MKIGVFSTFMSPLATPQMIRDFGRRAEDIGLDSIWMGEHVALFDKNTFGYPGAKDGRIPVPPGGGMLDVVATFGFLAAATSRLRLGTGVALVPQRNPIYTAKEVARWIGCRMDGSISASALAGTRRRSRPAVIAGKIAERAAMSSWRSCSFYGPSRWSTSQANG
jgi:hypothetical protein